VNIMNKQSRTAVKGWPSSLGVGHGANNPPPVKIKFVTKRLTGPRTWMDSLDIQSELWIMDYGSETFNLEHKTFVHGKFTNDKGQDFDGLKIFLK
jgi:hypothetical protein